MKITGFLHHCRIHKQGRRNFEIFIAAALVVFLSAVSLGYYLSRRSPAGDSAGVDSKKTQGTLTELRSKNSSLRKKIKSLAPQGTYIVIDTGRNRLFLKKGEKTVREAVISSGSGNILQEPNGKRKWVFDTPRGEFAIKSKVTSPLWIKPDWAFLEEGETVPRNANDRIEEGVLGDYALGFGDGYFIHGTLYKRLLGRNVTHGCIRVGDEDLQEVYSSTGINTKVFIF